MFPVVNVQPSRTLERPGGEQRPKIKVCSIEKAANESFGFGINRERGAVIHSVDQGSPADRANVKPNDIILYIDKQYVRKQKFEKIRDIIKRASQQTQKIELTLINPEDFKHWILSNMPAEY